MNPVPDNQQEHPSSAFPKNLVILLAGPTGVGKSDVAAQLCQQHGGLVVSADSVQAYTGVQIGANKPTLQERQTNPHLLVDLVDAQQDYNVAEWQRDALFCIDNLLRRDHDCTSDSSRQQRIKTDLLQAKELVGLKDDSPVLPVVVGGTSLFFEWLVHGRPAAVKPNESDRQRAEQFIDCYRRLDVDEEEDDGYEEASQNVAAMDPLLKTRVEQLSHRDWYRLRRTLEIAYSVERNPALKLEDMFHDRREGGLEEHNDYDIRCFFLCPHDRMKHAGVIDERCDKMLLRGLIKETTDLHRDDKLPAMAARAIGYRQTLDYLNDDDMTFDAFVENFATATRQYAKRQMQWFRKDPSFCFIQVNLDHSKSDRVNASARRISELCELSRMDFVEKHLRSEESESFRLRQVNEEQGEAMKVYLPARYCLIEGSAEYQRVTEEARECKRTMCQAQLVKRRRLEAGQESK